MSPKKSAAPKPSPEPTDAPEPQEAKWKPPVYKTLNVTLEAVGRIYGGLPADPEVMKKWIEAKGLIPEETIEDKMTAISAGEVKEKVEASSTVFRKDAGGRIYLRDFQVKQMMKETGTVLGYFKGNRGSKTVMTIGLVVKPVAIYFSRNDVPIVDPDGYEEFQGRVQGPQGPRSVISRKAYVDPGATISFSIKYLENGVVKRDHLEAILNHAGEFVGVGSARSRESGKFQVVSIENA